MILNNWKKFLESKDNKELYNNIKDIFQELIDDGYVEFAPTNDAYQSRGIFLSINIPGDHIDTSKFDVFFNAKKKHFEVLKNVKECIDRLKSSNIEDIDINFEYYEIEDFNYAIDLIISEGSVESGDFWKIDNDDKIVIDYSDLKEYLNLPKSVKVGMSSDGSQYILSFYFKTGEELESYSNDLIKDMIDYKIIDKDLVADYTWSYGGFSGNERSKYKIFKDYDRHRSTGYYDTQTDIVHYISFGLNKDLNISW